MKHFTSLDQEHKPWRCVQHQKAPDLLSNSTDKLFEGKILEYCKEGWTYDRSIFSSTIVTEVRQDGDPNLVLPADGDSWKLCCFPTYI
ncbi:hypothetical protein GDO81_016323 [Engystomops pustulosus]|uniref:Uncharacterized protein n=1 Tax=Engystomops pustulosus TaxID=76066 RepID=A0AAV7AX39_ENGPU|nr:hypothetical protein GDO81_016323 [Engystomops pustulosus]